MGWHGHRNTRKPVTLRMQSSEPSFFDLPTWTEDQHLYRNLFGLLYQWETEASGLEDWVATLPPSLSSIHIITRLCSLYHESQAKLSSL